ncbi:DUF4430 domain-containing protein [Anaerophilus nitritogenes]|uniref:DUF4430 domain-containing protein n=1 Tax=Anaerophilus nitritogenes TaxID=2498136 RepID=UPI00101E059D|nr:DUF4430 domain-containing protein [Anaerophilus nitritogenes]
MSNKKWRKQLALYLSFIMIFSVFSSICVWADEGLNQDITKNEVLKISKEENMTKTKESLNKVVEYYRKNQPTMPMDDWEAFVALWAAGENFEKSPWKNYSWKKKDPGFSATVGGNDHIHHIFSLLGVGKNPAKAFETNRNLFAELAAQQNKKGSFGTIGKTVWAIVALDVGVELGVDVGVWNEENREKAIEALIKEQNDNGSFGSFSNIDNTGWALIVLSKSKGEEVQESIQKAKEYLKSMQLDNGAFGGKGQWDQENSNSIACAIQGLVAIGENVVDANGYWAVNGKTPVNALLKYQNRDGSFRWKLDDGGSVGMATKQAAIAVCDMVHQSSTWYRLGQIKFQDDTSKPEINKEELTKAIEVANKNKDSVVISVEGQDVSLKDVWVTEKDVKDYVTEIKKAQTISYKANATQEEVDNALALLNIATQTFNKAKKNGKKEGVEQEYVTISIEKFTLGQGYYKEPIKMPLNKGDNGAKMITRLIGEGNYKHTGKIDREFYLAKVRDDDKSQVKIPQYILDKVEKEIGSKKEEEWLGEFDYTSMSGWMYSVNNKIVNYGFSNYIPKNGDVIRCQFTVYGLGADLGGTDFMGEDPYITPANKDALTAKIAEINSDWAKNKILSNTLVLKAYHHAYDVLKNMEGSQESVDDALLHLDKALVGEEEKPIEIVVEGLNHNMKVNKPKMSFKAYAKDNESSIVVILNDKIIKEQGGQYNVTFKKGKNTLIIKAVDQENKYNSVIKISKHIIE